MEYPDRMARRVIEPDRAIPFGTIRWLRDDEAPPDEPPPHRLDILDAEHQRDRTRRRLLASPFDSQPRRAGVQEREVARRVVEHDHQAEHLDVPRHEPTTIPGRDLDEGQLGGTWR